MYAFYTFVHEFINGKLLIKSAAACCMDDSYKHKGMRERLVSEIRRKGIRDEKVLNAVQQVPRHLFMESGFERFAYKDQAFPIGAGQTISQPFTVAFQTSLLDVKKGDKVLEVGTGSGYQAAILAVMGIKLYTIERHKELYLKSMKLLTELGYQVNFFFGDGHKGLPQFAPFDSILVTAASGEIPDELVKQLKTGGKMVIPVGGKFSQKMILLEKTGEDTYKTSRHGDFVFVPMVKGTG